MSQTPSRNTTFPPLTTSRRALLVNGQDREFREVVGDLVEFASRLQEIREALARRVNITPPQYKILMALAHREDEGATVSEMAEELRVSVPFVVTETRRLVTAGLLRKLNDAGDRRRVNLTLTARGRKIIEDLAPMQRTVNDVLFASLDQKDLKALGRLARGLLGDCDAGLALAKPPQPRRAAVRTAARRAVPSGT